MDQPNSNTSHQQKQQRRKRKDPESRDFSCRCGKSYLSYAAAYTHVKNKHNGDGEYLNNISRPDREKLKRGRPKQKKAFSITEETQKLSVIEQAILYIYEAMQKNGDPNRKIILEGNQQLKQEQVIKSYEQLTQQFGTPALTLHLPQTKNLNKNLHQFIQNMNKHFVSQIAAKIIWIVNYVLGEDEVSIVDKLNVVIEQNGEQKQIEIDGYRMRERAKDNICLSIWGQGESISQIVITALEKWMLAVCKNQQSIQKHD